MYGVLRIAAYAYKGPRTTLTETHSHVVLLLLECNGSSPTDVAMAISELRGAQVMDNDAAGQWNVTAAVGARNLALIRDSKSREVISRSTDGHAWKAPDGAFEVDETP